MTDEERAKGYVRPLRFTYVHTTCGSETVMTKGSAELWAKQPGRQPETFCGRCHADFPAAQFVWIGSTERVGT